jgi:hypothetical protein
LRSIVICVEIYTFTKQGIKLHFEVKIRHHVVDCPKLHDGDLNTTVGAHLGGETSDLAGGEVVHAGVISVVHEVRCKRVEYPGNG